MGSHHSHQPPKRAAWNPCCEQGRSFQEGRLTKALASVRSGPE